MKKINNLFIPASEGQPVSIEGITEPRQTGVLEIDNLKLMILAVQQDNGRYLLSNFFSKPLYFVIREDNGSLIPCHYYIA